MKLWVVEDAHEEVENIKQELDGHDVIHHTSCGDIERSLMDKEFVTAMATVDAVLTDLIIPSPYTHEGPINVPAGLVVVLKSVLLGIKHIAIVTAPHDQDHTAGFLQIVLRDMFGQAPNMKKRECRCGCLWTVGDITFVYATNAFRRETSGI